MRKVLSLVAVFVLLTNVVGCPDTPAVICHDLLVFWNELADNQLRATDEATAKEMLEKQFKELKARQDTITNRMNKNFNTLAKDKDMQKDLKNAWYDYYDEAVATAKRLHNVRKRLDAIIGSIQNDADKKSLIEVRDLPIGYLLKVSNLPNPNKPDEPAAPPPPAGVSNNPIVTGIAGTQTGNDAPKWGAGLLPEPPLPKPKT